MIPVPSGVRVWLATGRTDMRKGMNGLALQIQEMLRHDPYGGHLFVFRGRRGDLIMIPRAHACLPSASSGAASSGRHRPRVW
jgi:transposase